MNIIWKLTGLIVLVLQLTPAAAEKPPASRTVKIGAILPLTGEGAFWGTNARNGLELALEDINKNGGINGNPLELVIEDGYCSGKASVSALHKLLSVEKVSALIGEICSSATLAIAPIAQQKEIVLITPCSESPLISDVGRYIFRTWTPNNRQARTLARYARKKLGLKTAAILAIFTDYGKPLAEAFEEDFTRLGGKIIRSEFYNQGERDFRTLLLKIKRANPQAIYLISHPPDGAAAVKQIRQMNLEQLILGTSAINSPEEFFEPLGRLADGIILSDLLDTTSAEFRVRYENKFGRKWPGVSSCAGVGYDDLTIIAEAIRNNGLNSPKIRDYIAALKNYPGVSGPITFDQNGDLDREHAVFKVKNGKLELMEYSSHR
jgi:branched-chain amino acid transport system substrate-binding protein